SPWFCTLSPGQPSRWPVRYSGPSHPQRPRPCRRWCSNRRQCRPPLLTTLRRPGDTNLRIIGHVKHKFVGVGIKGNILNTSAVLTSWPLLALRPLRPLLALWPFRSLWSAQVPDLVPSAVLVQIKIAVRGVERSEERRVGRE